LHLAIGIVQPVKGVKVIAPPVNDGQITRLTQQGLNADIVHIEFPNPRLVCQTSLQFQRAARFFLGSVEQETR